MKRIILVALCIAIAGTFAIVQAHEDTLVPDCGNCETVEGECCCGGTVDGCTEDCDSCDCECEEDCTCDTECSCDDCTCNTECDDCSCDDCSTEEDEEEVHHCGGCH